MVRGRLGQKYESFNPCTPNLRWTLFYSCSAHGALSRGKISRSPLPIKYFFFCYETRTG